MQLFTDVETRLAELDNDAFRSESLHRRWHRIGHILLELIQEVPEESFLLAAVVDFIQRINQKHILPSRYHIVLFEFWLNHFSGLSEEDNYKVRAKIAGKYIPREDYQILFPIGMGKVFFGSHFVAAHLAPDVDTTVSSFLGWLDSFAARVGSGQHIWSLPGGPPDAPITDIFCSFFGKFFIESIPSTAQSMTLTAMDLLSQYNVWMHDHGISMSALEPIHEERALLLLDEEGAYVGDWHGVDAEIIRKIIVRFKSCLRWFENNLHVQLIAFFAQERLHVQAIPAFLASIFGVRIEECEPVKEFTERQRKDLDAFYRKVLGVPEGLKATFGQLIHALSVLSVANLAEFQQQVESLQNSDLFDSSGYLIEDRPKIFHFIERVINSLDIAIQNARDFAEQLDVVIKIKKMVLGVPLHFVTLWSDVESIRVKMGKYNYLPVVIPHESGKLFPLGVIWNSDLLRASLGTVSFRDFCSASEVRMASYLVPISVLDHHKASLRTDTPPTALITDSQSSAGLVAEQAIALNRQYSLGGMTSDKISQTIKQVAQTKLSTVQLRIYQRLLQRQMADRTRGKHYIHPERELAEYILCLYAILDDTDLLTKVSKRDVDCVAELLNRIATLKAQNEVEVIQLDDIPQDANFAKIAAQRILQNPEMYALYQPIYAAKETELTALLSLQEQEQFVKLLADTKEQNGCCRIGQIKLFATDAPIFQKGRNKLMEFWVKKSEDINREKPEIDLHLLMISTVASAEEVYKGQIGSYSHQDELWFWIPRSQKAQDHLTTFLSSFVAPPEMAKGAKHIVCGKGVSEETKQVFSRNWPRIPQETGDALPYPVVVLFFDAGTLNSRKSMITPYLPRITA